jgi:LPPG:FO 2-phospho-L-lactate transferase
VIAAIMESDVVFIAPSNPWLSIDPLLALPAIRMALKSTKAPIIAVSPLIEGTAVKGPTAKLMGELGLEVNNASIAAHYGDWLDGMIVHGTDDAPEGLAIARADTLMKKREDRLRVAGAALALAIECAK